AARPMEEQKLVIGIDLGTADSYVAYVRGGAIEVVQNEVSQRKTPSLVGFTDRERLLGDTALSQIKSNSKNTCRNFKHLLGQRFDSPAVESEKFWSTCPLVANEDGFAGYSVGYKGETAQFSATEVAAMFLTKLKQVTEELVHREGGRRGDRSALLLQRLPAASAARRGGYRGSQFAQSGQ
ncbi:unnamed protein product, partial [Effrenium voratum]